MTAKEYLLRLRKYKRQADNKIKEYNIIRANLKFLQGLDYQKDRVQVPVTDAIATAMAELVDAEVEAAYAIKVYTDKYNEGVNRINSLSRHEYVEILSIRYLEDDYEKRRLESIACVMHYSYDRVRHMHGEALQEFTEKYLR